MMPSDDLYTARAEAEAGIARCDLGIKEAQRKDGDGRLISPLAPFLPIYVHARRGYALTAARHAARIEREELEI